MQAELRVKESLSKGGAFFCSNFGRRLAFGNSPEATFALLCKRQSFNRKNSLVQAQMIFSIKILHISKICSTFAAQKCAAMMEIVLAIIVLAVAAVLLSVGVIFRKDHRFRSQHIHENERMKRDKIHCAVAEDKLARRKAGKRGREY